MANSFFKFKQFTVHQDRTAMKVTTDSCLFGAWVADTIVKQGISDSRILDIGTGTGLLPLMLAQQTKGLIEGIEIDPAAFEQATANKDQSPWAARITILQADARQLEIKPVYDIIVSNPPFYEKELKSDKSEAKNIAHHDDGLLWKDLVTIIENGLTAEGSFFLLLPAKRMHEAMQLFNTSPLFVRQLVKVRPSEKHDCFRIMISGGRVREGVISVSELAIKGMDDQYTELFVDLLARYYLNL